MQFRDLGKQYLVHKECFDRAIQSVLGKADFIHGAKVGELEKRLAQYVGTKHCITCANGTDALQLALMAWGLGAGDAVFVPDFTFFSSGEVVSAVGAQPIFVDVCKDTFNIDPSKLEAAINRTLHEGKYHPKAVIAVDLFGQPADYDAIRKICTEKGLLLLEDGAQGFGGQIGDRRACSFGDIATTSFFPAKPLGCYGDGGAIFTDNDEWATLLRSLCVHGKGEDKYDNIRIGMNSRLDTIQAAVLLEKLSFFDDELTACNKIADQYTEELSDIVRTPVIKEGFFSSWAQYTILLKSADERERVKAKLTEQSIPSAIYYRKPMHEQGAFDSSAYDDREYVVTKAICDTCLSLPMHPYLTARDVKAVIAAVSKGIQRH